MKFFVVCLNVIFLYSALFAQTYNAGDYQLRVYQDGTHPSLSYRDSPLYYDTNPHTSLLQIFYNNSILTLDQEKILESTFEDMQDSISLSYTINNLGIEEELAFLEQDGRVLGLEIINRITNNTGSSAMVGLRRIIDTSLGENQKSHFATVLQPQISSEYSFQPSQKETFIRSSNGTTNFLSYVITGRANSANRVILGNLKRLSESPWNYRVDTNRNFSYPPFSENDSAIMIVLDPKRLEVGESLEIGIVLSHVDSNYLGHQLKFRNAQFVRLFSSQDNPQLFDSRMEQMTTGDLQNIQPKVNSIQALNDLIVDIDNLLASRNQVPAERVKVLREIFELIKKDNR